MTPIRIFNFALDALLIVLSYVVPKRPGTYLFGAGDGELFRGNTKYLYLYGHRMRLAGDNCTWITHNRDLYDELTKSGYPAVYQYSFSGFRGILTSNYLVMEAATARDILYSGNTTLGKFNFIQTWHGIGFKACGLLAIQQGWGQRFFPTVSWLSTLLHRLKVFIARHSLFNYKLFLATSEETKQHFEKCFSTTSVAIIGYPRNDIFFNPSLSYQNCKIELGLSNYTRVIVYVPTYRDHLTATSSPFSDSFLSTLNDYLESTQAILLIKKHPYDKTLIVPESYQRIRDISNRVSDIQELLVYTDLLITDYSSVVFDYILCGRPAVFYPYDYNDYIERDRGLEYDYYKELPGPFATNEQELFALIKNTDEWFNDPNYQPRYQALISKFYAHKGDGACQRFFDYVGTNLN